LLTLCNGNRWESSDNITAPDLIVEFWKKTGLAGPPEGGEESSEQEIDWSEDGSKSVPESDVSYDGRGDPNRGRKSRKAKAKEKRKPKLPSVASTVSPDRPC
jgi:hypothetical protein